MSASKDVDYQLNKLRQRLGETVEQLAARGFYLQMEIYSANAMTDLVSEGDWDLLDDENRQSWLDWAAQRM